MDINKLRELISENKEIAEVLDGCSDDFLSVNSGLILTALDDEGVKPGYKIKLEVDELEGTLNWTYVPAGEETERMAAINSIRSKYAFELPNDDLYLLDLQSDINWIEAKRNLVAKIVELKKALIEQEIERVPGFWLYGPSNTGKTRASIALLNLFAKNGKNVAFVNLSDLTIKTQSSFNTKQGDRENESMVEKARKADVVVIDDIGSERPTPWFKSDVLLPILDYRFKSGKTTIFTSNNTIEKFGNKLKSRSQNPEVEEDINRKIIARISSLTNNEMVKVDA